MLPEASTSPWASKLSTGSASTVRNTRTNLGTPVLDFRCNRGYAILDCSLGKWRSLGERAGGKRRNKTGRVLGGVLVLGKARVHKLRGACWTDRHHAQRAGREEALGLREAVSEDAQLLHALARPRGAAGRHLHRVEVARDGGGSGGRLLLRDPLHLRFVAALLPGRSPLGCACDHGSSIRHPAGGDSHRGRGGLEDRQTHDQPPGAGGIRGLGLRGPLLL